MTLVKARHPLLQVGERPCVRCVAARRGWWRWRLHQARRSIRTPLGDWAGGRPSLVRESSLLAGDKVRTPPTPPPPPPGDRRGEGGALWWEARGETGVVKWEIGLVGDEAW